MKTYVENRPPRSDAPVSQGSTTWDCPCGSNDRALATAARKFFATLDSAVPCWRERPWNGGDDGEEVNAAWDALVEAVEGGRQETEKEYRENLAWLARELGQ